MTRSCGDNGAAVVGGNCDDNHLGHCAERNANGALSFGVLGICYGRRPLFEIMNSKPSETRHAISPDSSMINLNEKKKKAHLINETHRYMANEALLSIRSGQRTLCISDTLL
ncbi:hypothetical protein CEXT_171931 [Caerostris extrusa]|uniref:Uncharacterized protein n=1 Tax=Caerostris extrusa TaxID=172846 RepID=A0AAV4V4D7_CAEEX|nr:hypothetical protein CEXT_171931 [Caerostris extrusa]